MAKPAKRKCPVCGKWFRSSRANAILCPEDEAKERQRRAAAQAAPPAPVRAVEIQRVAVSAAPAAPASVGGQAEESRGEGRGPRETRRRGDVESAAPGLARARTPGRPEAPAPGPRIPAPGGRLKEAKEAKEARAPLPPFEPTPEQVAAIESRYRELAQPGAEGTREQIAQELGVPLRAVRRVVHALQEREKVPTPEQVAAIESRYRELAQPEFDGIRHQIVQELGVPLRIVRQVVKALRECEGLDSWWEARRPLEVPPDQMAAIKERYLPTLPLPPIGIHKQIATELQLHPLLVYDAITRIRDELGLVPFNERPDAPPLRYPPRPKASADGEGAGGTGGTEGAEGAEGTEGTEGTGGTEGTEGAKGS